MLTTPNHSIFDILYRLSYSAVTIFSNDIEIATLDQNRKKIEWSILPSQSYNFHESKKSRLMTDVSKLHCISCPVVAVHIEPEVEGKVDLT